MKIIKLMFKTNIPSEYNIVGTYLRGHIPLLIETQRVFSVSY